MQAVSKSQPLQLFYSLSGLRCQNPRAHSVCSILWETRSGSAPSGPRNQLFSSEQGRKGQFTVTRPPLVTRWRCSGKQGPDSDSDPGTNVDADSKSDISLHFSNRAAFDNYCATLKNFKDLRFKLVSEASLLGLFVWWFVVHHDDYLTLVNGYPPKPNLPPVVPILLAVYLFFTVTAPCRGDFQETRELGKRCDELRKALPSGLKARPLKWDSEDEEQLRYNLTEKALYDAAFVGGGYCVVGLVGLQRVLSAYH